MEQSAKTYPKITTRRAKISTVPISIHLLIAPQYEKSFFFIAQFPKEKLKIFLSCNQPIQSAIESSSRSS